MLPLTGLIRHSVRINQKKHCFFHGLNIIGFPMYEIEYDLAEEDLIHFNELNFLKSEAAKKKLRFAQFIVPGILAFIGVVYGVFLRNEYAGLFTVIFAVVMSVVAPYVIKWDMRRQVMKYYTDEEKANILGHYKLKIEPKVLVEQSPSGENTMAWGELLRVEYGKRYVYIYLDIATTLIIPVDKMTSGDLEKFAEQADKLIDRYS